MSKSVLVIDTPEKLKQRKEMTYWNGVIDGWNQCINKITGGGDDEFSK